jgi:hypothetical protein
MTYMQKHDLEWSTSGVAYDMAKTATTITRSPRGAKPVSQAFFAALNTIPEASRSAVARAAQAMIRDELKAQREKIKVAAIKDKAAAAKTKAPQPVKAKAAIAKPAATKRVAKAKAPASSPGPETTAVKRRARKPVETPIAAWSIEGAVAVKGGNRATCLWGGHR